MEGTGAPLQPFTAEERANIKRFLQYPDWVALAASIQLGFPAASQPLYLVEDAFKRITNEGMANIRMDLCQCLDIERQMTQARRRFSVLELGDIKVNLRETDMLRKELLYWTTRLADDLGVYPNPFSQAMYRQIDGMGGMNGNRT